MDTSKVVQKIVLSHFGLGAIVAIYCIGGVYLFQHFEYTNEQLLIDEHMRAQFRLHQFRTQLARDCWRFKRDPDYAEFVNRTLWTFGKNAIDVFISPFAAKNGRNEWDFPSALFFTISVITTIGYGDVTPKTDEGQLFVIFYASVGLPMMIIFLANIGDFMADLFGVAYERGCCFVCHKVRKRNDELNRLNVIAVKRRYASVVMFEAGCGAIDRPNKKEFLESMSSAIDIKVDHGTVMPLWIITDDSSYGNGKTNKGHCGSSSEDDRATLDKVLKYDLTDLHESGDGAVSVPISLAVIVIMLYIFIGAIIFATWNRWSWSEGAYFSFVTLSTIGFGDLVPRWDRLGSSNADLKMFMSSFYIVFGLAVISMCFSLIVEEIIRKFAWVDNALGFVNGEPLTTVAEVSTRNVKHRAQTYHINRDKEILI